MPEFYIGLMSGTSLDGVDGVLADLQQRAPRLLAHSHQAFTLALRAEIAALNLTVDFEDGEQVLTEVSCKFRAEGVADELSHAGLRLTKWWTDASGDFGLSLSVK